MVIGRGLWAGKVQGLAIVAMHFDGSEAENGILAWIRSGQVLIIGTSVLKFEKLLLSILSRKFQLEVEKTL